MQLFTRVKLVGMWQRFTNFHQMFVLFHALKHVVCVKQQLSRIPLSFLKPVVELFSDIGGQA